MINSEEEHVEKHEENYGGGYQSYILTVFTLLYHFLLLFASSTSLKGDVPGHLDVPRPQCVLQTSDSFSFIAGGCLGL